MEARPLGENAERRDDTTDARKGSAPRPHPKTARRRSTQTPRETLSPSAAAALEAFVGGEDSGRRKTADVETVGVERCLGPSGGDDDRTWAGPALPRDDNDRTATEGEIEALRRTVSQPPQRRPIASPTEEGHGRARLRGAAGHARGITR